MDQQLIQPLREQLIRLISSKNEAQIVGNKVTLDWRRAELLVAEKMNNPSCIQAAIDLQKECIIGKIACFHSFFVMHWSQGKENGAQEVKKETVELRAGKSKYQSIRAYIKMRQHLIGKVNQFTGNYLKALFQDIDDIRFLNFQIITLVQSWKQQWRKQDSEPVFYEGEMNYLLKINNDNADLINLANFKKTKFISPPNPFFLSEDGNINGMGDKQRKDISQCMEVITKERTIDLKLAVEGALFVVKGKDRKIKISKSPNINQLNTTPKQQKSFTRSAREEMASIRDSQIKNIYSIKQSVSSAKLRARQEIRRNEARKLSQQQRIIDATRYQSQKKNIQTNIHDIPKLVTYSSQKRLQRYLSHPVNEKQATFINKKIKISGISKEEILSQQSKLINTKIQLRGTNEILGKYGSKKSQQKEVSSLQSNQIIRQNIEKKLNSMRQTKYDKQLQKRQIRQIKPKIKLLQQKQSIVQSKPSQIEYVNSSSPLGETSNRSITFYKQIQPIIEQIYNNQSNTQPNAAALQRQKSRRKSTTHIGFNLKKERSREKKQVEKQQKINNYKSKAQQSKNGNASIQAQRKVRDLSNSLKNLTIINIYKGNSKPKKQNYKSNQLIKQQEIPAQKHNASSFITQLQKPFEKNIQRSNLTVLYEKEKIKSNQQINKLASRISAKHNVSSKISQNLKAKEQLRMEAEKELQSKTKTIAELQMKIKNIQSKKIITKQHKKQETNKYFQKQKKISEIEAKILKEKILKQQQKFVLNRQKSLKLKEKQLEGQFQANLKILELEHKTKIKQYKNMLLKEQARINETQKLIAAQKNKYKAIEQQLAQKQLKQKLLRKMLQQKQQKELKYVKQKQQSQQQIAIKIQKQLKAKAKMEEQALKLIEQQKIRIQNIYSELVNKNRQIQRQNQQKIKLINEIDMERQRQYQKLKKIQQDMKNSKVFQAKQQQKQVNMQEKQDVESLKLKIKQQILNQMIKRKQLQQQQQQKQQQNRRLRLIKIEEQVALVLRAEQQSLQRQNQQFLQRIESIKRKNNLTMEPNVIQQNKSIYLQNQQSQLKKQQQFQQIIIAKEDHKNNLNQINEEKKIQQQKQRKQIQPENIDKQLKKLIPQSQTNNNRQQSPHPSVDPQRKIQGKQASNLISTVQISSKKEQLKSEHQTSPEIKKHKQVQQISKNQVNIEPTTHYKVEQIQSKATPQSEITQKYKVLVNYIKKSKIITIQDTNLSLFLDSFLNGFQKTVKQMIPWNKSQLEKKILTKKGDLYDCGSIGWLQQTQKYYIIGNIQCLDSIINKYGRVQIHQMFIFDKTSSYQKQALAKKIKQFQKISFIFQKKVEGNQFSIRFVIKLPKQTVNSKSFAIQLVSKINLEGHNQNNSHIKQNYGFGYLLSIMLKQTHNNQEIQKLLQGPSHLNQAIKRQVASGNLPFCKGVNLEQSNGNVKLTIELPFKYFRQKARMFYLVNCIEFQIQNSHSFVSYFNDNLAAIFLQHKANTLPLDFTAFQIIDRCNNALKNRQIDVILPIWNYSTTASLVDYQQTYTLQQKMNASLNVSSVSTSFLVKHSYVQFRAPYLVIIAQAKDNKLIRPIHSHLVSQEQIVYQNLNN